MLHSESMEVSLSTNKPVDSIYFTSSSSQNLYNLEVCLKYDSYYIPINMIKIKKSLIL